MEAKIDIIIEKLKKLDTMENEIKKVSRKMAFLTGKVEFLEVEVAGVEEENYRLGD